MVARGSFKERDDRVVARITPDAIADAATQRVACGDAEALFVSRASPRLVEQVAALQARIGIPATSGNHALGWHCLRLAGVADPLPRFGRLFTLG